MSRPRERLLQLWDGRWAYGRLIDGLVTFSFRWAPTGLATRRQLRAEGLRPGGQEPYAQIVWHRGRRRAYLYRLDLAKPRRTPSAAQLRAIDAALAARRRCPVCRQDRDYYIPRSLQACWDCAPDRSDHTRVVTTTTTPTPDWGIAA